MAARSPARARVVVGILLVLTFVVAVLAGAAALLGVARISASPPVFVLGGLIGFLLVLAGGVWLATRRLAGSRRRVRVLGLVGGVALALVLFVPTTFVSTPAVAPDPVRGQRFWDLPTGSRLAYVEVPGRGERRSTPVVFVHGGPGTPDMEGDRDYFGRLADDGFDVYVYDALGSGRSTRLARPQDYSLERDIADLEAIRGALGVDRLNLVGHSYGANVVAGYLATHPAHVERVVFSSPGSLDPRDASGALATSRLDSDRRTQLYAALLFPRNLLAYSLLQVNPDAAHAFATDGEMDTRLDEIYAISEPGLHCRGGLPADELPRGLGFYRLQYPQSATAPAMPDFRAALDGNPTPALVVKGRCDYLSWRSAMTYVETLPNTQLVYLRGGGHNAYQDEPERYLAAVRSFLLGEPSAIAPRTKVDPPDDYEGPTG